MFNHCGILLATCAVLLAVSRVHAADAVPATGGAAALTPQNTKIQFVCAHVVPKLFLTNGSYEYWGRCASLIHTTLHGKADAPPSETTRIYLFAGSQHTVGSIPPKPASAQNLTNTNDYRYALRALLVAMQNWVTNGTEPPRSQFPRLANGRTDGDC